MENDQSHLVNTNAWSTGAKKIMESPQLREANSESMSMDAQSEVVRKRVRLYENVLLCGTERTTVVNNLLGTGCEVGLQSYRTGVPL